jgi:hypothetical protein
VTLPSSFLTSISAVTINIDTTTQDSQQYICGNGYTTSSITLTAYHTQTTASSPTFTASFFVIGT